MKDNQELKEQTVTIELSELVIDRLNYLNDQMKHFQCLIETTLVTSFEQAGHKPPVGIDFILDKNTVSYKLNIK